MRLVGSGMAILASTVFLGAQDHARFPWDEMFERPLVKWAIQIGDEKSLPWGDPRSWNSWAGGYDLQQVPADVQTLLAPQTPVLVRMETLRRALAYSSKDPRLAYQVLAVLRNRVQEAENSGKPDALAIFDLGYFYEACRQADWLHKPYLGDLNGYSLVVRAIRMGGGSAPGVLEPGLLEMEFAAGLILLEPKGQHPYYPHFKTVVREISHGTLLEKNLLLHLRDKFEADTLEEMRTSKYLIR